MSIRSVLPPGVCTFLLRFSLEDFQPIVMSLLLHEFTVLLTKLVWLRTEESGVRTAHITCLLDRHGLCYLLIARATYSRECVLHIHILCYFSPVCAMLPREYVLHARENA